MKWSWYMGKVGGVKLFVHWTFVLLVAWVFMMYYRMGNSVSDGLRGVLFILALFACVTLHELGHALAARRYRIVTRRITLLPIGGVAQMEKLPEKPMQEFLVAVAGPLVNVVLAAGLYGYLRMSGRLPTPDEIAAMQQGPPQNLVFNLLLANGMLAAFNLLPAFPMDGGRMARALLSLRMSRARATRIAASLGQLLAVAFVLLGLWGNIWLAFIGIFIFLSAGAEADYESARSLLAGYRVRDILMTRYFTLGATDNLDRAVERLLEGQETEFLVMEGDRVAGVLTRNDIIRGLSRFGRESTVDRVMQRDVPAFGPDTDLQEAFGTMTMKRVSIAPVLHDGRLIGTIDRDNISEFLLVRKATGG